MFVSLQDGAVGVVLAGRGILESVEPETVRAEDLVIWEALVVANEREDSELYEAGIAFGFECGFRPINAKNGSSSSDNANHEFRPRDLDIQHTKSWEF